MSAFEIADGRENLTELACDGGLACSRISRKHHMHRHLLATAKSAVLTLQSVLHRERYFPDCLLHLVHADETVHIL